MAAMFAPSNAQSNSNDNHDTMCADWHRTRLAVNHSHRSTQQVWQLLTINWQPWHTTVRIDKQLTTIDTLHEQLTTNWQPWHTKVQIDNQLTTIDTFLTDQRNKCDNYWQSVGNPNTQRCRLTTNWQPIDNHWHFSHRSTSNHWSLITPTMKYNSMWYPT